MLCPIGGLARAGPRVRPLDGGRGGWLGGLYYPQPPPRPSIPPSRRISNKREDIHQSHGGWNIRLQRCRCGSRFVALFAMQAKRLCADVVSVAWRHSPCRRRDCVQGVFPWRGVIRHAGGDVGCRWGCLCVWDSPVEIADMHNILPCKSLCILLPGIYV